MEKLLLEHLKKYPKSELIDLIKFLYQQEFGCAHAVNDEEKSYNYLINEWNSFTHNKRLFIDIEYIGNKSYRIHMREEGQFSINFKTFNSLFYLSSKIEKGNIDNYKNNLKKLIKLSKENVIPFDYKMAKKFITAYIDRGCKPVSHSDKYRNCYCPHYRVIEDKYVNLISLFSNIDSLPSNSNICIEGSSGSGKSTITSIIAEVYNCEMIKMDHFFLRPEQRTESRLQEIGGNIDYERFEREISKNLKNRMEFKYQQYDCRLSKLTDFININPNNLLIVEGVYSLHPKIKINYDLKIFLEISKEKQLERIKDRNVDYLYKRFVNEWIPMEDAYFKKFSIKNKCDVVLDTTAF